MVKYDVAISNGDPRARLHEAMHSVFDLPDETREHAGCGLKHLPLWENLRVGDASQKETEAFTRLMWPGGNDDFCNVVHSVGREMAALARALLSMILDCYGLGTHQGAITEATDSAFHLIKYSAPGEEELALGEHTDNTCLTVLGQNDVTGLAIKNNQGEWVEVDPSKGYFVVFVGQSLRALTNGRLHATLHQVSFSGVKDRLSYVVFLTPKPDSIVEALPEMVDEKHPRLFRPFAHSELAKASRQEAGGDYLSRVAGM